MRQGFLQDILEHPDDHGPRLVYADWLDENGDPQRAEFIRVQCELARLAGHDPGRDPLERREEKLLRENASRWLEPLPPFARKEAVFGRGFVERVTVRASLFVKHAKALFQAAPLRHASLTYRFQLGVPSVPDPSLRDCPFLARLSSLKVGGFMGQVGGDGVRTLVASPHLAGLRALDLSENSDGVAAALAVAESPYLGSLTSLDLSTDLYGRNPRPISDEGAAALAGSPRLGGLRELRLGRNRIGPAGVAALAGSPHLRHLASLDLRNNQIGPEGARALARSENFAHLTTLNLASNRMGDQAVEELLTSGRLPALEDVNLSVWTRDADLDLFGRVFAGPVAARLKRLVLNDRRFSDAIFPRLAPLRLQVLGLATCEIGPEGARQLADMPLLEGLRELDLRSNRLGDEGAIALARSPRARNLRVLRLGANQLGPEGAEAIASSPYLAGLRELDLYGNTIGNKGAAALAASPCLATLRSLRLHNNGIFKSVKPALKERFGAAVSF
jgi:uncharacterized protein (TIGR02996 family)